MKRVATLAIGISLVFAACSSADDAGPATTSAPTALATTTTSIPTTVATTTSVVAPPVTADPEEPGAEVVFVNGTIETMTEDLTTTDALAVTDGEIIALGADAVALVGSATRVVDLEGRAALPGIVDPHTHALTDDPVGFEEAQDRHISLGYTSIGDTGLSREQFDAMADRSESGDLRLRLTGYLTRTDNCGVDEGLWYEEIPAGSEYGDRFRITGIKIFNDGGTCGPLALSEPFFEGGEVGPTFFSEPDLTEMVRVADDGGYQVVIHAQGDLAVAGAQDAIGSVLDGGANLLRHRIDHNVVLTPDIVGRSGELGIVSVAFAAWPTCADLPTTEFSEAYGENWRALLDANPGAHIAWHGDDPWVPPFNPLIDLYSFVTRAEIAEDGSVCEPEAWLAAHAITVDEALVMMTREAAYALGIDDLVGTLEVGKRADLIVLDASPRAIDPSEIADLVVRMTVIDGRIEYCDDQSGLCG
jgi:predicted amidohydrolase YtcJ